MIRRTLFAAAVLVAAGAAAQGSWQGHMAAAERWFALGNVKQAESQFRAALKLANGFPPGDRRLEETLEELGRLYENESRLDKAQPLYELQVAAVEARSGTQSPALLAPLAAVGRTALAAGDSPAAGAALARYAEIAERAGTADPDEHRLVLSTLARMDVLAGDEEKALTHQRGAVALLDDGTATATERAAAVETLAQLEIRHGSPATGEQLFAQAASLHDMEQDGKAAGMLAHGAGVAFAASQPEVAYRLANRALEAGAIEWDELAARTVLADVAWLASRRGGNRLADLVGVAAADPAAAATRRRLQDLASLQARLLPEDEPARITTLLRLMMIAAMQGDTDGALGPAADLLTLVRAAGDRAGELTALENLATLLEASGRPADALTTNGKLLATLEAEHGREDRSLLWPLERQERLLRTTGDKRAAKRVRKRLKRLTRKLAR